ncbi:E3 ubiquitin-protein ligase At1g12760-like [Rosa chinensis]|uniref:E3 ubiquitin-protein ligase At1g12760-like n=1 Tax=Rosa chinensis TaxID=74649 RepID=UPI000D08F3C2|nr:E3 ubiquitin-protein ligase At1g12760-like [Rosa chinensis]
MRANKKIVAQRLLSIGVPEEEEPTITEEIFKQVDVSVPELPLVVIIVDVTVLDSFEDDPDYISWSTEIIREAIENFISYSFSNNHDTNKRIPATISSITELVKLRFDGLEKATLIQTPSCAICLEDFAQTTADQLLTTLPCTHHYHLACIVKSLEVSHRCPLCRYPMPIVVEIGGKNRQVAAYSYI